MDPCTGGGYGGGICYEDMIARPSDILCDGSDSDDNLTPQEIAAKRRKIENIAMKYLEEGSVSDEYDIPLEQYQFKFASDQLFSDVDEIPETPVLTQRCMESPASAERSQIQCKSTGSNQAINTAQVDPFVEKVAVRFSKTSEILLESNDALLQATNVAIAPHDSMSSGCSSIRQDANIGNQFRDYEEGPHSQPDDGFGLLGTTQGCVINDAYLQQGRLDELHASAVSKVCETGEVSSQMTYMTAHGPEKAGRASPICNGKGMIPSTMPQQRASQKTLTTVGRTFAGIRPVNAQLSTSDATEGRTELIRDLPVKDVDETGLIRDPSLLHLKSQERLVSTDTRSSNTQSAIVRQRSVWPSSSGNKSKFTMSSQRIADSLYAAECTLSGQSAERDDQPSFEAKRSRASPIMLNKKTNNVANLLKLQIGKQKTGPTSAIQSVRTPDRTVVETPSLTRCRRGASGALAMASTSFPIAALSENVVSVIPNSVVSAAASQRLQSRPFVSISIKTAVCRPVSRTKQKRSDRLGGGAFPDSEILENPIVIDNGSDHGLYIKSQYSVFALKARHSRPAATEDLKNKSFLKREKNLLGDAMEDDSGEHDRDNRVDHQLLQKYKRRQLGLDHSSTQFAKKPQRRLSKNDPPAEPAEQGHNIMKH